MSSDSAAPRTGTPENSSTRRAVYGRNQERRRSQRFPFNADAEVLEPQSGTKIRGRVTDISLSGCYVDTLNPLLSSTPAQIRIVRGSKGVVAQASVAYCELGEGMGLGLLG